MNRELCLLRGHEAGLMDAAFSPDGARLVTASEDTTARVWEAGAADGGELFALRGHVDVVRSAEFSPDGGLILTASEDGTLRLWPVANGGEPRIIQGPPGGGRFGPTARFTSAGFSPDGRRVVASLNEGTIRVWDSDTEQELAATHGGSESRPSCAVFSPDGELVVITNSYPLPVDQFAWSPTTAALWDTVSGDRGGSFGHQSRAYCAAFSPDGGRVVVGYEDATTRVWAAGPFGETLLVLEGHEGTVRGAAFSPDGGRIVTASQDATARVWDAGTGQELLVLGGHEGWVTSAAFSPDGGRIVTASGGHNRARVARNGGRRRLAKPAGPNSAAE